MVYNCENHFRVKVVAWVKQFKIKKTEALIRVQFGHLYIRSFFVLLNVNLTTTYNQMEQKIQFFITLLF